MILLCSGVLNADPLRLDVEFFEQEEIGFVNRRGGLRPFLQLANRSDVVDMGMRAYDLFRRQTVLL